MLRNPLSLELFFPCRSCVISPLSISKIFFPLFSVSKSLIIGCFGVDFYRFILFVVCPTSCNCRFMFISIFGFSHYLFEYSFSSMNMWSSVIVLHIPDMCSFFFFFSLLCSLLLELGNLWCPSLSLLIILSSLVCCYNPSIEFFILATEIFLALSFPFGSSLQHLFICWDCLHLCSF